MAIEDFIASRALPRTVTPTADPAAQPTATQQPAQPQTGGASLGQMLDGVLMALDHAGPQIGAWLQARVEDGNALTAEMTRIRETLERIEALLGKK